MVTCKICHKEYMNLPAHLSAHDLKTEEYQERFPDARLISKEFRRRAGMPSQYSVNETFFDSITPVSAYILGLIISDGYLVLQPRVDGEYLGGFAIDSVEREIPAMVRKALETEAPVLALRPLKTCPNTRYRMQITNPTLAQRLVELGCPPRKSLSVKFPDIDMAVLPFFVRGVFDGDGGVGEYGRGPYVGFVSGSQHFADGLLAGLRRYGIGHSINVQHSKNTGRKRIYYRVRFSSVGDVTNLFRLMYSDLVSCPYYLTRKYDHFVEVLDSIP